MFNPIGIEFMGNWWSHGKILGDQMHFLEPDDGSTEVLLYWGSNSYVTHQIPGARAICREFSENPDKMVIVVDPRLSETARMADMHIMPALGTDSLFLRALIAIILENGWQNQAFIDEHVSDWDKTKHWFENVDIDGPLRVCGIPRSQAEEFARILTTKKWGMHQDLGLFFGRHNTMNSYLCIILIPRQRAARRDIRSPLRCEKRKLLCRQRGRTAVPEGNYTCAAQRTRIRRKPHHRVGARRNDRAADRRVQPQSVRLGGSHTENGQHLGKAPVRRRGLHALCLHRRRK